MVGGTVEEASEFQAMKVECADIVKQISDHDFARQVFELNETPIARI